MGNPEDTTLRLVGMIYDAALDERKWPSFLQAFAQSVCSNSAFLRATSMQAGAAEFVASHGYDPACQNAYCNHFVKLDYLTPALSQFGLCEVKRSEQVFNVSKQRKTEYYNDYMLVYDKAYGMGAILSKDSDHTLVFSTQRGIKTGDFGEKEMRLTSALMPHVARAVQVHRKIGIFTAEKEWALGALDQLRMGVILTDISGRPLFANCAAETMLTRGRGIATHQGRLALFTLAETARLYQLIAEASQSATGAKRGGDMRATLPDGNIMHCLVMPISLEFSARWGLSLTSDCVAIFLSRPGGLQLSPKRLAALYGLTPAEARLAARLAALRNVEEAADDLCITAHTARSQLKSVFAKIGVQSQSELLMLLATGALAQCRDE